MGQLGTSKISPIGHFVVNFGFINLLLRQPRSSSSGGGGGFWGRGPGRDPLFHPFGPWDEDIEDEFDVLSFLHLLS